MEEQFIWILSLITSWLFPISIFVVIEGVVVDLLKKRFYWSKFALIFFVITVILLVIQIKLIYRITGDILNNSSNETVYTEATRSTNWKTYTNTKYGFYFKHPADWIKLGAGAPGFSEFPNLDVLDDDTIRENFQPRGGDVPEGLTISILLINSTKSYATLAEEELVGIKKLGYDENPKLYPAKIGPNKNIPAVIVNFSGLTGNAFIAAYTQLATNKTLIFYGNYPLDSQREIDLFNQILFTFRFLETTPSPASTKGQFCGGIANIQCPSGYKCQLDGSHPDAGGNCVKKF